MNEEATRIATTLFGDEGFHLDRRDWPAWLELYLPDAVYWVPAWRDEATETQDPDCEVSLIYHDSRVGLEERVMRIRSRQSVTALPLPRTTHFVSNVSATFHADDRIEARASWQVQIYDPRTTVQKVHHGWYEMRLQRTATAWRIARKKIHLQNDCVAAVLDFYLL